MKTGFRFSFIRNKKPYNVYKLVNKYTQHYISPRKPYCCPQQIHKHFGREVYVWCGSWMGVYRVWRMDVLVESCWCTLRTLFGQLLFG